MRVRMGRALAVGGCALVGLAFSVPDEAAESATFTYQPVPDWSYALPRETWIAADEHCGVAHQGDDKGFLTEQTGPLALEIDTNGDGKLDAKVKGETGFAKLRGRSVDGNAFNYAVRIKYDKGYKWSSSGVMSGTLNGQTVRLIDQDCNGEYDDFGVDAMLIGASQGACYLSKVINLGGELFDLDVSKDGTQVTIKPFTGEFGTIDLASQYTANGDLVAAVIKSGDCSFNVAESKNGMKVPAAKYDLVSGFVEKGLETVVIKRGKSLPIQIDNGTKFALTWGGPIVAEFEYAIEGDTINVPPSLYFYGSAGEEYGPFKPDAKSPKILITDKKTGKLVASGRFGGC